ncbi:MAG TPA: OmpA family protein [Sandaracinaceae bacterium LLY-WYZ-13_1]|nr:OmpA family protein [Sandaracinaceae bacterium LLY-WYZ-13_1]
MRIGWLSWTLGVALTLSTATANAQDRRVEEPFYLTVDLGVTGAVNDPVEDQFELGGDAAVGAYYSLIPELALGGRVMGGLLTEGHPVPQDPVDRGVADFGLIAASVRVYPFASLMAEHTNHRASGFYLAASPGVGLLDGEVVPGWTASTGYNFPLGPISIGPRFRFTHFIETEGRFGDNDVFLLTGGIELAFNDEATVIEPEPQMTAEPAPEPEPEPPVVQTEPAPEPEVNPALVVSERAYFDYDGIELRESIRDELDAVVAHWREHGDRYERLVITGHADDRGSQPYNEALSAARALAVTNYLVRQGVPIEILDIRGYGESAQLEQDATTPMGHQLNRRVQFEVQWAEDMRPVGVAPEPEPNMPEVVDPAPERVRENPERFADPPPARVTTRADELLAQVRQDLRDELGTEVSFDIRDMAETEPAGRVEVVVEEGGPTAER